MIEHYREFVACYFRDNPLNFANIDSFNRFVSTGLQNLINEIGDVIPTIIPQEVESYVIRLRNVSVGKPVIIEADGSERIIYPAEARLRSLTYSAPIHLEVCAYVDGVQRETFTTVVGKLPIMLKSTQCHLHGLKREELIAKGEDPDDPGGYFIINGNERVLISIEDLASNRLFINKDSLGALSGRLFSSANSFRIPHLIERLKDGIYYLSFTRFKRVPLFAVIKALGLIRDQKILELVNAGREANDDAMYVNLYELVDVKTQDDALEYLAKKMGVTQPREIKIERARDQLDKYLLPHLGTTADDRMKKAYNLCKYLRRYLLVVEDGYPLIDKDHYGNKRLHLSGDLLADLFRTGFRSLVQDIMYNFQRLVKRGKFQSIKIIIRDELLSSNIKSALATGAWPAGRKGVSQNMERANALATTSHLQRVNSLLTSTQENFAARALHSTHWGFLCPIETPEGTPIGLRKNFSLLCSVSKGGVDDEKLLKQLEGAGLRSF